MTQNRIQLLEQYLKEDPADAFSQYALALEYAGQGKNELAVGLLSALQEKQPTYLATYYQLGKLNELAGKRVEAIKNYREGLIIAKQQNNIHTINELKGALELLTDDEV